MGFTDNFSDQATIAAIATPVGAGGIGIIRISGPDAMAIGKILFRKSYSGPKSRARSHPETARQVAITAEQPLPPPQNDPFKSHHLYHGHIHDPDSGRIMDEVLLVVMKAPHSYTREDVVEIQAHAGHVVLRSILALVLKQGARLAEPGEFTRRAFLNGRLDLSQAEAIIDVINAKSDQALVAATAQLKGELKLTIDAVRQEILQVMTLIEAQIDFPDEVEAYEDMSNLVRRLEHHGIQPLVDLLQQYENAHILRDGLMLSVIGRPNVGKSSLMNRLLKKERVIVTAVPGTTRDLVQESINVNGVPVIVSDTAGLHDSDDPVESIGIAKTHDCINDSDLVLFMVDASQPYTAGDQQIWAGLQSKKTILVGNKSDLMKSNDDFEVPAGWKPVATQLISALHNQGIDELKELIAKVALGEAYGNLQHKAVPNLRHKAALEKSLMAVRVAVEGMETGLLPELVAIELKSAIDALGEITGVSADDDVLEQIFKRFCIGK